jgi:hypothetical protein
MRSMPKILLLALVMVAVAARADAPGFRFEGGGNSSVSLMTPTGDAFLVDVTIGGRGPFPFAVDTGSADVIDASLARELGLTVTGTDAVRGAGEHLVEGGVLTLPSMELGRLTLRDHEVRVLELGVASAGYFPPYRGIIGHTMFEQLIVRIDQDAREVVMHDPAGWSYDGRGLPLPLRFHGHLPVVSGSIDGVEGRFTLDTGQANSLTLFRPFLIRERLERRWPIKFSAAIGWGVGGDLTADVARATVLALGPVPVERPVVYLSRQRSGAFADAALAGNVGQGVMVRFNVTFAYARDRAWFERAGAYGRGDDVHEMTLKRSFGGFTVLSILPGGAAFLAGVRPGDVIEMLNLRDAATIEDDELQRIFRRAPGSRVSLQVRSAGVLKNLELVLRPTL